MKDKLKRINDLLQEWDDVDVAMKFPEAEAFNVLVQYVEDDDLLRHSHETDQLIDLAISVLENSHLRKGYRVPIGKCDANGEDLYEGDIVTLVPAAFQNLPLEMNKSRFRIVRIADAWYFDPIEFSYGDGFSYAFSSVQNIEIDPEGNIIITENPPVKVPTLNFASSVIFKIKNS